MIYSQGGKGHSSSTSAPFERQSARSSAGSLGGENKRALVPGPIPARGWLLPEQPQGEFTWACHPPAAPWVPLGTPAVLGSALGHAARSSHSGSCTAPLRLLNPSRLHRAVLSASFIFKLNFFLPSNSCLYDRAAKAVIYLPITLRLSISRHPGAAPVPGPRGGTTSPRRQRRQRRRRLLVCPRWGPGCPLSAVTGVPRQDTGATIQPRAHRGVPQPRSERGAFPVGSMGSFPSRSRGL